MSDATENPTPEGEDKAEATEAGTDVSTEVHADENAEAKDPSLVDFQPSQPGNINPEVLQNIVVSLSIEVGRAQIKNKDLMRLTQGLSLKHIQRCQRKKTYMIRWGPAT